MTAGFCPACGGELRRLPDQDGIDRLVCAVCGGVHYVNPNIYVVCVAHTQKLVLGNSPRVLLVEGEGMQTAAVRALREYTGLAVTESDLFLLAAVSDKAGGAVYMVFRAPVSLDEESVRELPRSSADLAWLPVLLERFLADLNNAEIRVYVGNLEGASLQLTSAV